MEEKKVESLQLLSSTIFDAGVSKEQK